MRRKELAALCPEAHFSERVIWDIQLLWCGYLTFVFPFSNLEMTPFLFLVSLDYCDLKWLKNSNNKFTVLFFQFTSLSLSLSHLGSVPSLGSLSLLMGNLLSRWKPWNQMEHYFWPQYAGVYLHSQKINNDDKWPCSNTIQDHCKDSRKSASVKRHIRLAMWVFMEWVFKKSL